MACPFAGPIVVITRKCSPAPTMRLNRAALSRYQIRVARSEVLNQTAPIGSHRTDGVAAGAPNVAVIIPTFNERDNVRVLIERLGVALAGVHWEAVFVDDDSTDGTIGELHTLARAHANVRLLHRVGRRGLSSAVIEGILSTTAPLVAVIDADLQHDEKILPQMLHILAQDEADIVVGSRYIAGGSTGQWSDLRLALSQLATRLAQVVLGARLSDPMSGFFMLQRQTFTNAMRSLSGQGYKILLDIIASSPSTPRIRELPYVFGERRSGESKLDSLVALEYAELLLDKTVGRVVPVRFVMFAAVGGLGVVVHMLALTVLLVGGAAFIWGQAAATLVAMTFNFFVNNKLTYRDRRIRGAKALLVGLVSFYAVCGLGALANVGIANVLFESNYSWWLSAVAGILVGVVWNFAATSVVTWRR